MMEAVVAACALVAYSDGWVSPEETLRMRRLILRFEPAQSLGLIEILRLFEEVTFNFTNDHHAAEKDAFERVSQLATRSKESRLLIDTCCGIAEAVRRQVICDKLALSDREVFRLLRVEI
jgi:tellurite resistance protein TerB